jgi:pyruvate/2-oxoglutarate dehydrogenase complex dihydrolipoamide dehydrogenase (E3) component
MANSKFDLLILGSGSTAFAAALRAAELGKTAAMTEIRTLGAHVLIAAACQAKT